MTAPNATSERTNTSAARGVRLLLYLLAHGELTTARAARLLEVPPRRARADLQLLAELAPVSVRGRGKDRVWVLDPGAGLGNLGVLDRVSLRMGRELTSFLDGTVLHEGLVRASEGGWWEALDRWNRNMDRKFRHLQEPARAYGHLKGVIDTVLDGLIRQRQLGLDYQRGGVLARYEHFQPLTLVLYRRAAYLLGRAGPEEKVLRLAVDRLVAADVGEPFDYPETWQPDDELGKWFGIVAAGDPERVVLRFPARVARLVHARVWHPTARLCALPDGGVELTMVTAGPELVRFALEWGAACEVIEPPWLRQAVRAELGAALAVYTD